MSRSSSTFEEKMNHIAIVLVSISVLLAGCATTSEQPVTQESKESSSSGQGFLAAMLIAASMENPENAPVFEATVTDEESQFIERIKQHFEEKKEWATELAKNHGLSTAQSIDLREEKESGSLYGGIHRSDDTRVVFRISRDLSVTYSTLPNEFYKTMLEKSKEWKEQESEYDRWGAFWDALPQALSHL